MSFVDSKIGRYWIHSFLRPGRVGDVYMASTPEGKVVWLKIVHDEYFAEKQAEARFEREARILSKFDHPAVLDVIEWGRTRTGVAWLALEPVEGPSLKEALAPGPFHVDDVAKLARGLAEALEAAHGENIILRDVVPDNILLIDGSPRHLKLLDLGFTRLIGVPVAADLKTSRDTRIGDPTYMAPEYIEDTALDHRADLYSMGVVLYQALVGRPPFTGKPFEIMLAQTTEEPEAPVVARPDTPPALQHLVLSLLEKQPELRPRSAREVIGLLQG